MLEGPQIVYFHGIPGSAGELSLFGSEVARATSHFEVAPRMGQLPRVDYFDDLASQISRRFVDRKLHFVGFSLGAAAALRVAARLGHEVSQIDLISTAAPLDLGDYLTTMAGAPVFALARSRPSLFGLQVSLQAAMGRLAPHLLMRLLFSSAQGGDKDLAKDGAFRANMVRVLTESFSNGREAYRREIGLYVEPWATELALVTQPVTIHHGDADNWSPVAMAQDLAAALSDVREVRLLPGQSHYSTLRQFLAAQGDSLTPSP